MLDRPKVRDQTKSDAGVYAVRGRWRFTSGTRLSSDVTAQVNQ